MSLARQRFSVYESQLTELFQVTARKREKAWSFYKGRARDIIFRLEALCRLYRMAGDKKKFDPWYKEFKALEDTLGSMDHFETMLSEFGGDKRLGKTADKIFRTRLEEETGFLDDVLRNNDWLNGKKMKAFSDDLDDFSWNKDEEDLVKYAEAMLEELQHLEEKYRGGEIDPSMLEGGLHEFRRRLRWLGIYAACANGAVQLRKVKIYSPEFKTYCTPEVINSPYNVLPKNTSRDVEPIILRSHYFYAMSWLIGRLGELKDIGLRHEGFLEVYKESGIQDKKRVAAFIASCACDPREVTATAEVAIDDFVHRYSILEFLQRDLLRFIAKA